MIQIKVLYLIFLAVGTSLLIGSIIQYTHSQKISNLDDTVRTNVLNLSEPVYQALSGNFLAAKDLATKPSKVTEESFFEEGVMKNVGNVTNNMSFFNTYLPENVIQAKGKGTIKDQGGQKVDWISSDVGIISGRGMSFHGVILFNNIQGEKFAFLNNTVGIYSETPEIKRTIWLMK